MKLIKQSFEVHSINFEEALKSITEASYRQSGPSSNEGLDV